MTPNQLFTIPLNCNRKSEGPRHHHSPAPLPFIKAALLIFLACITSWSQAQPDERSLKLELPKTKPDAIFTLRDELTFNIVLTALSVEDQNALESLTVDDWRYDEPNYFSDGRVPNIVLHVERKGADGRWNPVPFKASSQGSGANLQHLDCHVTLVVFPDSSHLPIPLVMGLAKRALTQKKTDAGVKQDVAELQKLLMADKVGEFRLTATYSGVLRGSGRQILKAPPLEFKIQAAP